VGLEITNAGGTHNGASCVTGATLMISDSYIHGNSSAGVSSSCSLTLDGNIINGNAGGGVKLTGGSCTVTNNIVAGNGSSTDGTAFGGVAIDRTTTVTSFSFNTVIKNHVTAGVGGVDCGTGTSKSISNSTVWDNDGTQLGAQCSTSTIVSGTGTASGSPVFTADGHLQAGAAGNSTCCVDKVASPSTPNADHDVDRSHRPQGTTGKWTIGANELSK